MIKKYNKLTTTTILLIVSILCISYFTLSSLSKPVKDDSKPKTKITKDTSKSTPGKALLEETLQNGKPTVLYFTSEYCRDCLQVKPIIDKLEKKYSESVNFLIIDVRAKDSLSKEAIKKFKILGVPIAIFVKKDGTKSKVLAGYYPENAFEENITTLLEK
ncbi:MAG: thioredoxin family protein [Cyanobacteriota bacterium]